MPSPVRTSWFSTVLVSAGALLFAVWVGPATAGLLLSRLEIARFQADHAETAAWAPGRVSAYRKALHVSTAPTVAVLRIPAAAMEVPVLEGTSDLLLNRGAGHVAGSAHPGADGNVVLAGHRDGFFRRLKDVHTGDRIELQHDGQTDVYRVDTMRIAERGDTSMLRAGDHATLTLITCYPFFYLGPAPQRYVVHASLVPNALQARLHQPSTAQEN